MISDEEGVAKREGGRNKVWIHRRSFSKKKGKGGGRKDGSQGLEKLSALGPRIGKKGKMIIGST